MGPTRGPFADDGFLDLPVNCCVTFISCSFTGPGERNSLGWKIENGTFGVNGKVGVVER